MRDGAKALRKRIDRALRKPIDVEELGRKFTLIGLLFMAVLGVLFMAYAGITLTAWPWGIAIGITAGCLVCGLACTVWTVLRD